jgi:hypothetical protein
LGLAVVSAIKVLVPIVAQGGEVDLAARLLGYSHSNLARYGSAWSSFVGVSGDGVVQSLRDSLSEQRLFELLAEGAEWNEDQAVDAALSV